MAETIGLLILEAAGATASVTGFGSAAITISVAGATISAASVVGAAAITAAAIGLQYALAPSPSVPKPESGSQAIRQSAPPRIRGYWINRLAGSYMMFEAGGPLPNTSYDVIAFHHGKIDTVLGLYLSDDEVTTAISLDHFGTILAVQPTPDGYYGSQVNVELWQGIDPQPASTFLTGDSAINSLWTSAFHGHGIAYLVMKCTGTTDPAAFTKKFPRNKPEASVVARCSPVWDPRDGAQSRSNPATWTTSPNPVLHLIDYLTGDPLNTGGPGLDYDTAIAPVLTDWMAEAELCDALVDDDPRYQCAGWYRLDNNPEDVVGKLLSTCDGWLSENGDGTLSLVTGYYRAPDDPPLTGEHIVGASVDYGIADESVINQLTITITDPNNKYVSLQLQPYADEASVAIYGVRDQPLDLTWVQWPAQAGRLARRAMLRVNPAMQGSLITTLYGFRYLGKRWTRVQYPEIAGLEDAVIEIQSAKIQRSAGQIVFGWKLVDPDALLALQ